MLLVIIVVSFRQPSSNGVAAVQPTNLVVTLVGFTNSVAGPQALFFFTNGTPHPLHFQVMSLDFRTSSGWEAAPETRGNRLVGSLGSEKGYTWPCDVDNTNTTWRLQISCVEQARGVSRAVDRGKELVNELKTGHSTHRFTGRMYDIVSSEAGR